MTSSTPHPTPNPRPFTVGREAAYAAVYNVIHEWPAEVDAPRENARVFQAVEAALDALDLPARDARIRAETAREVAEDIAAAIESHDPTATQAARTARHHADQYDAPAETVAAASVVSAEGSVHPQPASVRLLLPQPVLSLDTPEGDTDANH